MTHLRSSWRLYFIGGAIALFAAAFLIATQLRQHGGTFLLTAALVEMFLLHLFRRHVIKS